MKKVTIYGQKHVTNTGGYDPEDSWSRNSSSTDWMVMGCGEFVPNRYCAFDDIETDLTGDLYAVYVIHSGGDSFGHDEAAYFDFVWVFDKLDMAQEAVKIIKDHADWYHKRNEWRSQKVEDKRFKSDFSVNINIGKTKPLTVCASWNGNFESLNEVDIVQFRIGE